MTVKRATRVAERVREELALLVRGLADPRVKGAIVSRVEMPDDLSGARVFVRRDLGAATKAEQKALLAGLDSASNRLRKELTRSLDLRRSPSLRFTYDEAPDDLERIERLIREVKSEGGGDGS